MPVETELGVLKSVVNKLDSSLEKISEVSNSIGRLLAVHDERIGQLERSSEKKSDDIKELHSRISTQTREIVDKIVALEKNIEDRIKDNTKIVNEQHKEAQEEAQVNLTSLNTRLSSLENWRWYVLGAVAVVAYLIGNLSDIAKYIK